MRHLRHDAPPNPNPNPGPLEPTADDPTTPEIEGAVFLGEVISAAYPEGGAQATVRFRPRGDRRLIPGQKLYLGAGDERADSYVDPRRAAISRMNSTRLGSTRGIVGTKLEHVSKRGR